jgi:hypothetical protein
MMINLNNKKTATSVARGAVLLEAVLALVLFAAAAVVMGMALNGSMESVERLRLSAHATDIAVSTFSELQIGIRSAAEPQADGETSEWTVEIITQPWGGVTSMAEAESSLLTDVEVVVRHQSGFVHRGRQVMKLNASEPSLVRRQAKPGVVNGGLAAR